MKKKKKYKSVITRRIFLSFRKISTVILTVSFSASLFSVGGTNAIFTDQAENKDHLISTGMLEGKATYFELFDVNGMTPDNAPDSQLIFTNIGSLDLSYRISYQKIEKDSDDDLCDNLFLTAEKNGQIVYDKQPLEDFDLKKDSSDSFSLDVAEKDNWKFVLQLSSDAGEELEDKTCNFNFQFNSWQKEFSDNSLGFTSADLVGKNTIRTGEWNNSGDVVINELMWMGSEGDPSDEWLELRNMTDKNIDLSNWRIEGAGTGSSGHIEIPHGYTIKANGYFLILNNKWDETAVKLGDDLEKDEGMTHIPGMSLDNDGEKLVLEDSDKKVIDTVWKDGKDWPEGSNGDIKKSMERNDDPKDGTKAGNWHACEDVTSAEFWYDDRTELGTPGAPNRSENDSSARKEKSSDSKDIENIVPIASGDLETEIGVQDDNEKEPGDEIQNNSITEVEAVEETPETTKEETPETTEEVAETTKEDIPETVEEEATEVTKMGEAKASEEKQEESNSQETL